MQKLFLLTLCAFLMSSPVQAGEDALAPLEAEIDNMNITPPEREAAIQNSVNKKTYYPLNNYSPQKKKAIVKYAKELDKRYKRINKQTYEEPEPIDANDETDMKYFLKRNVNTELGGPVHLEN